MSPRPAWSAERIERLMAAFARDCPGYHDAIVLLDSTPVECGRSVETARRSELGVARAHHYSRRHSRWFWGCRARTLHGLRRPDRLQAAGRQRRHLAQLALRPTDTGLR
jgi:hypothetical protein